MTRITGLVPLMGDVFTREALDGLVGQTAPLTAKAGDHTRPIGRAEVVKAEQDGDFLVLTIDTTPPERERDHVAALLGHVDGINAVLERYEAGERVEEAEAPMSIGYTVADATGLDEGHREFRDVTLRLFGPSSAPFDRDTTLRDVARITNEEQQ